MVLVEPASAITLYANTGIGQGRQGIAKTRAEQTNFFVNHRVTVIDQMSYIRRENGVVRIEYPLGEATNPRARLYGCDYMSFRNPDIFGELTIYAKILDITYVNNMTVDIIYEPDGWQTLMFSSATRFFAGQVEREHLTQYQWELAKENPYRRDIFELETSEPLDMNEDMEDVCIAFSGTSAFLPTKTLNSMSMIIILGQSDTSKIPGWDSIKTQVEGVGGHIINAGMLQNVPSISNFIEIPVTDESGAAIIAALTIAQDILNALEVQGVIGNVMGLYYIPTFYFDYLIDNEYSVEYMNGRQISYYTNGLPNDPCTFGVSTKLNNYTPDNPKLLRWPYYFIRATDSCGQQKEYKYEDFDNIASGESDIYYFRTLFNVNGTPNIILAPYLYKTVPSSSPTNWIQRLNVEEGISYGNIPNLPFATDAYLSYLGGQNRESLNFKLGDYIGNWASMFGNMATFVGAANALGSSNIQLGAEGVKGTTVRGVGAFGNAQTVVNQTNAITKATHPLGFVRTYENGWFGLNYDFNRMRYAKDNTFAGSTGGYASYMRAPCRFLLNKIKLKPAIMTQYDRWLDVMGYASGRIKLPNVIPYIRNESAASLLPTFRPFPGSTLQVTYCKAKIIVDAPIYELGAQIEQMFNNGVLFFKMGE